MFDNILKSLSVIVSIILTMSVLSVGAGSIPDGIESPGLRAARHGGTKIVESQVSGMRNPRYYEIWFEAVLHVTDETGTPVAGADVWLSEEELTTFRDRLVGRTDETGAIKALFYRWDRLEVYFGGNKATIVIDERKESYSVILPFGPDRPRENVPGVVVSAKPDSSVPKRVLVTISGDPLTSEPEVVLCQSPFFKPRHSYPVSMSSESSFWSGTAEYEHDKGGILEVTAFSESGSSQSANPFGIYDVRPAESVLQYYSPQTGELKVSFGLDNIAGTGTLVIVASSAPVPANRDLMQAGDAWSLGFSDSMGPIKNLTLSVILHREDIRGLDSDRLRLFGWNRTGGIWELVEGGDFDYHYVRDYWFFPEPCFTIILDSADHTSYALFAPSSDDTAPPDPVTDFYAETGTSGWTVDLEWKAPADNVGIRAYDIRYGTEPVTESDWDACFPLGYAFSLHSDSEIPEAYYRVDVPKPADPGTVQTLTVGMLAPNTEYHFAIRSMDAAGNLSSPTFPPGPVKSSMVDDDGDGMGDSWEKENYLDTYKNDSWDDNDRDGLTNIQEFGYRTDPKVADTDGDGFSDRDETFLGKDPRDANSMPDRSRVRVNDEAGTPVEGADVCLGSHDGKIFLGKTGREGIIGSVAGPGTHLEAYFSGRKASADIDGTREEYALILPLRLTDLPGSIPRIILRAEADDSDRERVLLTLSSDIPLISEPEVTLHEHSRSAAVPMTSPDSLVWSGTAGCKHGYGIFETVAVSESGPSRSVNFFRGYEIGHSEETYGRHDSRISFYFRSEFSGSGMFTLTESSAPGPANGELTQVGGILSPGFPDSLGHVRELCLQMEFPPEQIRGLDAVRLNLHGWDAENRTWHLIPKEDNKPLPVFEITIRDPKEHNSYALFAPRSDDTVPPPDPVTGFEAWRRDERYISLRWTVPADNTALCAYDIRYSTEPFTESDWDDCASEIQPPGEPGNVRETDIITSERNRDYYLAIQAIDTSGNRSATTFLEHPVRWEMADDDEDGMDDQWEDWYGLDSDTDDSQADPDRDGLTNLEEYEFDTQPRYPDTDDDGYSDGEEVRFGRDPLNPYSYPSGNLDCDSDVDLADAIIALQIFVSDSTGSEFCFSDTNEDGRVGLAEAVFVLRGIAGEERSR